MIWGWPKRILTPVEGEWPKKFQPLMREGARKMSPLFSEKARALLQFKGGGGGGKIRRILRGDIKFLTCLEVGGGK